MVVSSEIMGIEGAIITLELTTMALVILMRRIYGELFARHLSEKEHVGTNCSIFQGLQL